MAIDSGKGPSKSGARAAIEADNRPAIDALLLENAELWAALDEPLFAWRQPPLAAARSVATVELHFHGADFATVGEWWTPGFFVRSMDPEVGPFIADRGVPLSAHAAAALGLTGKLGALLDADPSAVRTKGGDGATPL